MTSHEVMDCTDIRCRVRHQRDGNASRNLMLLLAHQLVTGDMCSRPAHLAFGAQPIADKFPGLETRWPAKFEEVAPAAWWSPTAICPTARRGAVRRLLVQQQQRSTRGAVQRKQLSRRQLRQLRQQRRRRQHQLRPRRGAVQRNEQPLSHQQCSRCCAVQRTE